MLISVENTRAVGHPMFGASMAGGPSVVGKDVYNRWNVAGLDLQSWGLAF
jgi:hypothetical protein